MPIPRSLNRSNVRSSGPHNADTCPLTLKWSFMMMLDLGGHQNLIQRHGFNDDELAIELGLQALIDEEDFHPRQALLRLKGERKLFDETFTSYDTPTCWKKILRRWESCSNLMRRNSAFSVFVS